MEKKLYRNEKDQVIAGVASGIGEHLHVDATLVRVGFILAVFAGLSGVLIYIILWIVIPTKPFYLNTDYRVNDDKSFLPPVHESYQPPLRQNNGRFIAGVILVGLGVFFLGRELNIIPYWMSIHRLWPLALIIPGILILMKSKKRKQSDASVGPIADSKPEEPVLDAVIKTTNENTSSE